MATASTHTYAEFTALIPWRARARAIVRDAALRALALGRQIDGTGWIRFPYYHHVFDDERRGFVHQINYLRTFGEFISIEDAVSMLSNGSRFDGRYFCLGFDDGFKCCATNALPILAECNIPAVFYVVSGMVGCSLAADDPRARKIFGFRGYKTSLDFMDWDDCRRIVSAGMTIGSHTRTHPYLTQLTPEAIARELSESKMEIEREVGVLCRHFCVPYGIFDPARNPSIASSAGYVSFATGIRGLNRIGNGSMILRRDHLLANWGLHQVRYFLSGEL